MWVLGYNNEIDAREILKLNDNLVLFEKNGEILCFKQLTPILFEIAFTNRVEFQNGTPEFENKGFFFYYYKLWEDLAYLKSNVEDMSMFYKC